MRCSLISIQILEELLSRSSGWNGRDPLGRHGRKWEGYCCTELGRVKGQTRYLACNRIQWQAVVRTVMNLLVPKPGNFLASWATMRFWKSLLYGDSWICSASEVTDNAQWVELFRLDLPSFRSSGPHCLSQRSYLLITVFSANEHVTSIPKVPFNARI